MSLFIRSTKCNFQCQGRLRKQLQPWQIALCGLYVMLFSLVLPFICFGKLAEPNHPHRSPHFVFVDPVLSEKNEWLSDVARQASVSNTAFEIYERYLAPTHKYANGHTPQSPTTNSTMPAGRATSSLVIFDLITLTLLCAWAILRTDQPHFMLLDAQPFPDSIVISIPLPPPRLILFFN